MNACKGCALWQPDAKPAKGESAEYLALRPCIAGAQPGLQGRVVESADGKATLTEADAVCRSFLGRKVGGGER